eukprot:9270209-Ditylum_brightwellii.AAC.1
MLVSRWSSDAFLLYIHRQVQEFTKNVSSLMISNKLFFTTPGEQANSEDSRARHDPQSSATAAQIGTRNSRRHLEPRFHLHN